MPSPISTLPEQPRRWPVALRGGTLLFTDDADESWSRLAVEPPDLIDLATAPG